MISFHKYKCMSTFHAFVNIHNILEMTNKFTSTRVLHHNIELSNLYILRH